VLEAGETLKEGIRREVREETGLEVEPLGIFDVFERITPDRQGRPEYHYVLIDFLCRIAGGRLVPGDDVRRAAWVPKSELDHYNITEGTRAVIERAFRRRRALLKL
jgi:ADP-ribose pyrophosphatase YjhB (NUDIX family)